MHGIIIHSGEWDKVYHAFNIASVYSSLGEEVVVFLTYWAVDTIVNKKIDCGDKERTEIICREINSGKIRRLDEAIKIGKAFGKLRVVVCSATLEILGIDENKLPSWVDGVGGLTEVLESNNLVFI